MLLDVFLAITSEAMLTNYTTKIENSQHYIPDTKKIVLNKVFTLEYCLHDSLLAKLVAMSKLVMGKYNLTKYSKCFVCRN